MCSFVSNLFFSTLRESSMLLHDIVTHFNFFLQCSIVWIYCSVSTVDGHLSCFQFLAIIEKATMYGIVQVFW